MLRVSPSSLNISLNALLLHDIFLYRSTCMEKLYRILQHTKDHVAIRLPDTYCWVGAQAKSQRRGLHTHTQLAVSNDQDLCDSIMI